MSEAGKKKAKASEAEAGITRIAVEGFKSLAREVSLEIRPLTLLAGANSSGKSSALQPLLLLKQTLEATFDPGPLLLHDAHVRFTSADQLLSRSNGLGRNQRFSVSLEIGGVTLTDVFERTGGDRFDLIEMRLTGEGNDRFLQPSMAKKEIDPLFRDSAFRQGLSLHEVSVIRQRCFLFVRVDEQIVPSFLLTLPRIEQFDVALREVLHVPGLRGNPERAYKTTAVGETFPGTFENYVASIVLSWQQAKDDRVQALGRWLERLGLTWKVAAKALDATQVEIRVGRLPHSRRGGASDLVNVADVGFGVSQVLPVLVALLAARPGQLVYLEQPEIHLHPRAQVALAEILCEAANRGVKVVTETHSSLLLLAIQSLVAERKISPQKIKLHWFLRGADGLTEVRAADLDEAGAYGEWPEDFGKVELEAEGRCYLDAAEAAAGIR